MRGDFFVVCFPVIAVVVEEVGDVAEDLVRDSVVEWHVDVGLFDDGYGW